MSVLLAGLGVLTVLLLVVLLVRGRGAAAADPRMDAVLDAVQRVGEQVTRMDGRAETLERQVRENFEAMRREQAEQAKASRTELAGSVAELRGSMQQSLEASAQRLTRFSGEMQEQQTKLRESTNAKLADVTREMNAKLGELMASNAGLQEKLRGSVEERLDKLNTENSKKLDQMRETVDEKLHATLQTRLTESFGQVTDQLTKVHAGLGEMNTLTAGVNDLNRIFSNVKTRGGFAEVQLGKLLEQVLAPGQYVQNARVKPLSLEVVEYAVKFPGTGGEVLLPIDAKFPREAWERLETAYESGTAEQIEAARKAFDAAIRVEGKRICEKYIHEPVTTPYAIMFLPTESLYSEVLRRDGLQAELHLNCRVMVAGPTNLYALLTSFQLGFKMLNLQKKGDEVWKVLAAAQTEFGRFGDLMGTMEKQVGTVQNTIQKLGVRTRAINKTLRDVAEVDPEDARVLSIDGMLPRLAANEEE
jgi:DNA recombination protein RmuC